MDTKYKPEVNLINDLFLSLVMEGVDIADPEMKRDIIELSKEVFSGLLMDENDFVYLNFDIKEDRNGIKVTANNIVTALLFHGIPPYGCDYIMKSNRFENNNGLYEFKKITKKLTLNGKNI